jgi:hypothetical protein
LWQVTNIVFQPPHDRAQAQPTRAQAEQRHAQLSDRALDLFLKYGYELATIEQIIASIGVHKNIQRRALPYFDGWRARLTKP